MYKPGDKIMIRQDYADFMSKPEGSARIHLHRFLLEMVILPDTPYKVVRTLDWAVIVETELEGVHVNLFLDEIVSYDKFQKRQEFHDEIRRIGKSDT